MQSGSQGLRSTLWMALAGISGLNLARLHASTPQKHSEEKWAISTEASKSTVHRAGENFSHNVQKVGHHVAGALLPKKPLSHSTKYYVGPSAVRGIKPFHSWGSGYCFVEGALAPTLSTFDQAVWENPTKKADKVFGLSFRPGGSFGVRHRFNEQGFFGLNLSGDIAPVLNLGKALEYGRAGAHFELGLKDWLLQANVQSRLHDLYSPSDWLKSEKSGPKIFAPCYLRALAPLWNTQQKVAVEVGRAIQAQDKRESQSAQEQFYTDLYWIPKCAYSPAFKKFFELLTMNLGLRCVFLGDESLVGDGQSASFIIQKAKLQLRPLIRMDIRMGGTASTAESGLRRFSAVDYYQSVALPDRNLTADPQALEWWKTVGHLGLGSFDGFKNKVEEGYEQLKRRFSGDSDLSQSKTASQESTSSK